jgi:hypothetical protein
MITALKRMFERRTRQSAARRYARELGARLRRDYGASEFYTVGQISTAVSACRLPARHLSLGYAAFLPEAEFRNLVPDGDYQSERALLFRYVGSAASGSFAPAPENGMALSGYSGSSHHGYDGSHHGS